MSNKESSPIILKLEEAIWLDHRAQDAEIVSLELIPDVDISEDEYFVNIKGHLILHGRFETTEEDEEESLDLESSSLADQLQFAPLYVQPKEIYQQEYRGKIEHRFPFDVTVPADKIKDIDDVYVQIEQFDYTVTDGHRLHIKTEVAITGIEEQKEQEESERQQEAEGQESIQNGFAPYFNGAAFRTSREDEGESKIERKDVREKKEKKQDASEAKKRDEEEIKVEQKDEPLNVLNEETKVWDDFLPLKDIVKRVPKKRKEEAIEESEQVEEPEEVKEKPQEGIKVEFRTKKEKEIKNVGANKEKESTEPARPEEAKAEKAKGEEARPEEEKAEKAKAEEARPEEGNAEKAKAEEARPEEGKAEKAKAEEARPEEGKVEKAKAEEARPEEGKVEKATAEEARPEEVKAEKATAEEARPEEVKAEKATAEEARPEEVKAEKATAEEARPEEVKAEKVKTEEARVEEAKAEKAKAEEVRPEEAKTEKEVEEAASLQDVSRDEDPESNEGEKVVPLFTQTEIKTTFNSIPEESDRDTLEASQSENLKHEEMGTSTTESNRTVSFLTKLMEYGDGEEEAPRSTKLKMCIIQQNESLEDIAKRYSISVYEIMKANRLETDQISKGQILYIPPS